MTRLGTRGPILIGIVILTFANISVWKYNTAIDQDTPSEADVRVQVVPRSEPEDVVVHIDDVALPELPPASSDHASSRGHIPDKPTRLGQPGVPRAKPVPSLPVMEPIPRPKHPGKEEMWDFPGWVWNPNLSGELTEDTADQPTSTRDEIDFNAIMKGSQPESYLRLFGNIKKEVTSSRKPPPSDYTHLRENYQVPPIETPKSVNCKAILEGDQKEMDKAQKVMDKNDKIPILEETYESWFTDCEKFKRDRGYVTVPLTKEEEEYPLAFSIAMYTDVEQSERLLRAVYQPQNLYCFHIDTKTSLLIHRTVYALSNCFDNVFVASHMDKIKWGDVSVLLPAVNCMRDMVKYHRGKWKYFINLTGQEMPLRTNWELVQIAKIFNGSNDIGGSSKRMEMDRVNYRWSHRWSKKYQQTIFYNTYTEKKPDPWNLTFYKGELHGLFSRKFAEYITEGEVGQAYLQWCWTTGHPTEHYWNVLNYNKHLKAPGGYDGPDDLAHNYSLSQISRAKHWVQITYGDRKCQGVIVRGICVYGLGDLPWLHTRPELVANKFHLTRQYLAYDCLEERHRNRTMLKDKVPFNAELYRNLPTVIYGRKDGL